MNHGHDTIGFEVVSTMEPDVSGSLVRSVRVLINGDDLLSKVREYEKGFAEKEGHADLAGGYVNETLENLRTKLLTPERWPFTNEDELSILVCSCREEGCWPLIAKIIKTGEAVTWSHFRQPHRGENSPALHWDYSNFGPFVFRRAQYDDALSLLFQE